MCSSLLLLCRGRCCQWCWTIPMRFWISRSRLNPSLGQGLRNWSTSTTHGMHGTTGGTPVQLQHTYKRAHKRTNKRTHTQYTNTEAARSVVYFISGSFPKWILPKRHVRDSPNTGLAFLEIARTCRHKNIVTTRDYGVRDREIDTRARTHTHKRTHWGAEMGNFDESKRIRSLILRIHDQCNLLATIILQN